MKRARCSGPFRHCKECRKGRPLCRWRRKLTKKYKKCDCDRYHFPHRMGSGRCGDEEKYIAWMMGKKVGYG